MEIAQHDPLPELDNLSGTTTANEGRVLGHDETADDMEEDEDNDIASSPTGSPSTTFLHARTTGSFGSSGGTTPHTSGDLTPGDQTPSHSSDQGRGFSISDDDLFSGLSLLDLLVVVDAHLELWTRGIRKKSVTWKEKADKLVEESKMRANEARQRIKLPRVNSDTFLTTISTSAGGSGTGDKYREGTSTAVESSSADRPSAPRRRKSRLPDSARQLLSRTGRVVNILDVADGSSVVDVIPTISKQDREKLERKYKEIRGRTVVSLKRLSQKWEEEKTVRLRDKISFFFGVMNVLCSALLLGFNPTWIPFYYTVQVIAYLPYRIYAYKKRDYHYFLFDLCYAINLLCLVYLWILPGNSYLFEACYGLTLGSLGTAIATWRNSLVFHSLDKVISLAIHIFPPFVFTTIRHFYPPGAAEARFPALAILGSSLRPWRSILINMAAYLCWQGLYYRYVIVLRKEKIKQGRATSFTFLINDKKRLIGKIAAKVPEDYREATFMLGQAVYTFVTLLLPIFVLYGSKFWSSVYLLVLFGVSVWNGAAFYLEVFARKFEKELIKLRAEFEEQQQQQLVLVAKLNEANNSTHSTSRSSTGEMIGEEGESEHHGDDDQISPVLTATTTTTAAGMGVPELLKGSVNHQQTREPEAEANHFEEEAIAKSSTYPVGDPVLPAPVADTTDMNLIKSSKPALESDPDLADEKVRKVEEAGESTGEGFTSSNRSNTETDGIFTSEVDSGGERSGSEGGSSHASSGVLVNAP